MCPTCHDNKYILNALGLRENCPDCFGRPQEEKQKETLVSSMLVPLGRQKGPVGFDAAGFGQFLKGLKKKIHVDPAKLNTLIGTLAIIFGNCKEVNGYRSINSTLLSAPIAGSLDNFVYACIRMLAVRGMENQLVPYITCFELNDLVMGKYTLHHAGELYAEVNAACRKLDGVLNKVESLKSLLDQGLLAGFSSIKTGELPVSPDTAKVLSKPEDLVEIANIFKDCEAELKMLAGVGTVQTKKGYTLDDYVNAPLVFLKLGAEKLLFKYELPGLSVLLDLRGRQELPTVVIKQEPDYNFWRDPDRGAAFLNNYVYELEGEVSRGVYQVKSQSRLMNVSCF